MGQPVRKLVASLISAAGRNAPGLRWVTTTQKTALYAGYHKEVYGIGVMGEERRIVADDSTSIRLFFLLFLDGVKHSDMRKVYVDLLCGRFTMLCAFFVYHNLGYKGSSIF